MSERPQLANSVGKRVSVEFTVFGEGQYGFLIKYITVFGKEGEMNHIWLKRVPERLARAQKGQRMRATALVVSYPHSGIRGTEYALDELDNLKWIQTRSEY